MKLPGRNVSRNPAAAIGGYELVEKIGEGGMCAVYKGRQVSLGRFVAIKVLHEKLSDDPEVRQRFEREAAVIARLNHPNIIHVIDRGVTPQGMPWFAMEYVEGEDLAQALQSPPGPGDSRKLEIAIQVCKALAYAHRNGIVHRDVKPANVLIDREGNALVLDFGIARLMEDAPAGAARAGGDQMIGAPPTRANLVLGTLAYMSPEQQTGTKPVSAASDLYSLGVLLYEMFTGTQPCGRFRAPSALRPDLPAGLEEVILRCLEPDPDDRFGSADEIKDHLLAILQGAHLEIGQKERADSGLSRMREKFALLDVIREDPRGGVYLYQDRVRRNLIVIKKRLNGAGGLNEARLLAGLRHPNVVEIIGASGDARRFIVVMEYLTGGSLKDRLAAPLPFCEALRVGQEICQGLSFAHKNRIVHGDLRPANVLFTDAEQVKLADFGFDPPEDPEPDPTHASNPYNPFGEARSPAADLFAAGTILYQILTGVLPAWSNGVFVPHAPFRRLPPEVQEAVGRMVSRHPGGRFATCDQALARLNAVRGLPETPAGAMDPNATVVGERDGHRWAGAEERPEGGAVTGVLRKLGIR